MKATNVKVSATGEDNGLDKKTREKVANELGAVLGDTFVLYMKTLNYHWNITGPHFSSLHALFEEHYKALQLAMDELAERIRSLGQRAPGTSKALTDLASLEENKQLPNGWETMVRNLLSDHEASARAARDAIETIDELGDDVTVDMLVERAQYHDKTAWMLRSFLED